MEFKLSQKQKEKLDSFRAELREKHGTIGFLTYKFTPTGVGTHVEVCSEQFNECIDISDVDEW